MIRLSAAVAAFVILAASACSEPEQAAGPPDQQSPVTVIRFAKLVDGTGETLEGHEIAVREGRIVAIGDGLEQEYRAATVIDNGGLTALPGLIDVHVHITYALGEAPQGDAWDRLFATPAEVRLERSKENARLTLETGVTSARDLFSVDGVGYALRAMIDSGKVSGPRLFLAGAGLHPATLEPLPEGETRDIVTEFSVVARARIAEGAEWIKIFATTGSASDLTGDQVFEYPEIKAVADIAHKAGIRVAVHSYGTSAVMDALRAGVDSIEHPVGMDDQLLSAWAATDTVYVPTIDHNRYYADHRAEYGYDERIGQELRDFVERNLETARRAHEAGITMAMGSDAVMSGFGENTRELEWFAKAGMTPAEVIQTATLNGAKLLGQQNNLGRLSVGFAADIIGVKGDPLRDITAITSGVQWVMKDGEVVVERDRR